MFCHVPPHQRVVFMWSTSQRLDARFVLIRKVKRFLVIFLADNFNRKLEKNLNYSILLGWPQQVASVRWAPSGDLSQLSPVRWPQSGEPRQVTSVRWAQSGDLSQVSPGYLTSHLPYKIASIKHLTTIKIPDINEELSDQDCSVYNTTCACYLLRCLQI